MKAINILTEYLKNPLGIECTKPRITWNLDEGVNQYAFSVIGKINDKEDFDSGIIQSSTMHYDFLKEFNRRDRLEYVVRIYSSPLNYMDSEINFFEIGLYSDFKGKWIKGDYKVNKNKRYPADYFHKNFESKNIVKARLYIAACGLYEASLNGKRIGDDYFAPGSTDYKKRIEYQTYDIKDYLKDGINDLNIILGDGWYRGSNGAKGRRNTFGTTTKLIVQIELTNDIGETSYILSDKTFDWSNDGPIRFNDLRDGEIIDLNLSPSYNSKAKETSFKANLTSINPTLPKEMERFKPTKLIVTPKGSKVLEFPQNFSGYLSFKLNAKANDKVYLRLGELLDDKGEFTQDNIQCIRKGKRTPLQEITVYLKDGVNEYKSKFFFGGFRYVLVDTNVDFKISDFTGIAIYNELRETAKFSCSNELINTFYHNSLWSLKSNSLSIPTDCPTRERMGWTGDSQVFFNSASYLTMYAAFIKKHLSDLYDRQWKSGRLAQIVPYSNEDWFMLTMNGSVGWADAGILIPYRFYLKYGDERILKEYYTRMKKYAHFMIKRCGKWGGVYSHPLHLSRKNRKYGVNKGQSYGEWAEPSDVKAFNWLDFASPHPEESTAYTSYVLDTMLKIMDILKENKDPDYELFKKYSLGTKSAYQEMVSTKRFSLDTDRQAKLVRPLYMKLLNESQEKYAKERLIKALENYNFRLGTGFLSTPFILETLVDIDKRYAYKLLLNEEMPGWLFMAKNDTTTIWEGWEGPKSEKGISSLNHYSKGALTEWLMSSMLGIKVSGENEFRIKPIISDEVKFAKGEYDSIYGTIKSSFEIKDNEVVIKVSIPSNTKAKLILPNKEEKELSYGNYIFTCEDK